MMQLLPRPTSYHEGGPGAELSDGMVISADSASSGVADLLASELRAATGWQVIIAGPGADGAHGLIRLEVLEDVAAEARKGAAEGPWSPDPDAEKYRLTVTERGVEIVAPTAAGVFYGTRTLRQLLPADLFRSAPSSVRTKVAVEGVEISDAPRFGWRGIGLDLSRHFFPKDFVLKLVDLASLHKLNVLHLHLTDDQGWRVQIDGYPRLTEVGGVAARVSGRPLQGGAQGRHSPRRVFHQGGPGRDRGVRGEALRDGLAGDRHARAHASCHRVVPRARQHG